jgi:hypothetical protein
MFCIVCYNCSFNGLNSRTKSRKCLISYNKNSGLIALNKHMDVEHYIIIKAWVRSEQSSERKCENTTIKERLTAFGSSISNFFARFVFQKWWCAIK